MNKINTIPFYGDWHRFDTKPNDLDGTLLFFSDNPSGGFMCAVGYLDENGNAVGFDGKTPIGFKPEWVSEFPDPFLAWDREKHSGRFERWLSQFEL